MAGGVTTGGGVTELVLPGGVGAGAGAGLGAGGTLGTGVATGFGLLLPPPPPPQPDIIINTATEMIDSEFWRDNSFPITPPTYMCINFNPINDRHIGLLHSHTQSCIYSNKSYCFSSAIKVCAPFSYISLLHRNISTWIYFCSQITTHSRWRGRSLDERNG
jgi:hypothetical protein